MSSLNAIDSEIYLKSLHYVDYFSFLWFYCHGKIKLVEKKTASLLHAKFCKLNAGYANLNSNLDTWKLHEESVFTWQIAYDTFMRCMQSKFKLPLEEYVVKRGLSQPATFEDFCMVRALIKREPEGLLSIWIGNDTLDIGSDSSSAIIATVAPFITRKTPGDTSYSGDLNEILREKYERNAALYNQSVYPLHRFFEENKTIPEMCDELQNAACNLASSLFQLINKLLDTDLEIMSAETQMLAFHIEQMLLKDADHKMVEHESCSPSSVERTHSTCAKHYLGNEFKSVIDTVVNWTPFPTCFWLIDKHMQISASEHESDGALEKIRQKIMDITDALECRDNNACNIIERIYKSNVAFIISRMSLVHPRALQYLYASIVNSEPFYQWLENGCTSHYIDMSFKETQHTKTQAEACMQKLNVLRSTGIAGTRNFLKIKCLHAHLAFAYAQDSEHGKLIKELMST